MAILEEIRRLIESEYASGATQTEIAQLFGVRQNVISRWRSGKRDVGKMQLETFLKMFPHAEIKLNAGGNTSVNVSGNGIQNNVTGENTLSAQSDRTKDGLFLDLVQIWEKMERADRLRVLAFTEELRQEKNISSPKAN